MATSNWTVYIPDRASPMSGFGQNFTPEEVRQALVASGFTAVENADMVLEGSKITFRRPTGGTKGA